MSKSLMLLECIIGPGKETREPNWKMIEDKLINSTFSPKQSSSLAENLERCSRKERSAVASKKGAMLVALPE